jgi:hypothetical protein
MELTEIVLHSLVFKEYVSIKHEFSWFPEEKHVLFTLFFIEAHYKHFSHFSISRFLVMKIHVIMTDNTRHGVFPMMLYISNQILVCPLI